MSLVSLSIRSTPLLTDGLLPQSDDLLRREEEELQRALAESAALADPLRNFQRSGSGGDSSASPSASKALPAQPQSDLPSHVRGLYDFEGETSDELAFKRGEVVRVLEKVSEEWWRGELRGRVGIFPTNYVVRSTSCCSTCVIS